MDKYKKFSILILSGLLALGGTFFSAKTARAVNGEGTATINDGTSVTVERLTSNVFTVVLTVGATGIAADAADPTFTIPTGFTAPTSKKTSSGAVTSAGDWYVEGAGVGGCATTIGSSSATLQVITADVTTACLSGDTVTLTYKGTAPTGAMAATNFDIKTADTSGDGAATSITTTPTHTVVVKGTAVFSNHATAGVATTNNLAGRDRLLSTDKVLGGFNIAAAGEDVAVTSIRTTVTIAGMTIGELSNLRIVTDANNDGTMQGGELSSPLATIASPVSGNNDFTVSTTVTGGSSKNYFIVGTLAVTVTHGDTIAVQATGANSVSSGVTSAVSVTPTGTSSNSTMTVTDTTPPVVSAVVITTGAYKIGSVIPVTITADAAGYTAGAITINGATLGSFVDAGAGSYTGTYTVVSGNTNRASVGAIPVSVVLTDSASNSNSAYVTAPTSGGTVTIDANAPSTPTASLDEAYYFATQTVTFSSTGSDAVYYSTTGTATCSSTAYTGALTVSATQTFSVVGCDTAGNISSAASFTYIILVGTGGGGSGGGLHTLASVSPVVVPTTITTNSVSSSASIFTKALKLGSKGADVVVLQAFLVKNNFLVMPAGVPMGTYGALTTKAIKAFQVKYGIAKAGDAGYGNFGPMSRAKANMVMSAGL